MKNLIRYFSKTLLALAIILMTATGCSDFLDINTDPNNPLDSKLSQVLPSVQTVIFEALGNGSGGMSDLTSQYVHHTVQRGQTNFYFFAGNEFNIATAWPNLYSSALKDVDVMITKSNDRQSWHYLGIAQTLKAYTYSIMVDMWGKAAFAEFGQGTANPFPGFDDGETIYPQLLTLLNDATTNLAKDAAETPGTDDLIFGGNTTRWIKLANSLKLKLYNQLSLTPLYDAAAVADIIANDDLMSSVADGFKLLYGTTNNPENRHPMFKQDYADNAANNIDPYFYLIMKGDPSLPVFNPILENIGDPRVPYYFFNQLAGNEPVNPVTTARFGDFLSIWFASFQIDPNEGFDQAQYQTMVGQYPCGGAFDDGTGGRAGVAEGQNAGLGGASYTRLYPYLAHLYTRAELSLTRGAPGNDRTLFEAAMRASFAEVNELAPVKIREVDPVADPGDPEDTRTDNDVEDYVNAVLALYDVASVSGKLELILTEKWIASFGFSIDSYTDYRRTGFPIMFDPNTDGNPFTILNRVYPVSIPYFIDDLQINPNAAPQRDPGTDKVFWDVD